MKLNKILLTIIGMICLKGCESQNYDTSKSRLLESFINEGQISVVAPAAWIDNHESTTIQKKYPNLWGKIHSQYDGKYPYLSNTDEQRFNFLLHAFDNKTSSVIWALRGGYGSGRVIPNLLNLQKPIVHKWLVGYSDITALHLFVSQKWGWKSIHGSVVKEILDSKKDPKNLKYLEEILAGTSETISYQGLKLLKGKVTKPIAGQLTGGNTTLISTSIGTPWQISAKGKVVVIEESGHGDRIDRVLQHLKHSKILDGASAIIIGDIIVWDADADLIINDFIKDLNMPVFKTDIFGHGDKNYPWIYNADAVIEPDVTGDYQLTFKIQ